MQENTVHVLIVKLTEAIAVCMVAARGAVNVLGRFAFDVV